MSELHFIQPKALGKPPGYTSVVEVVGPGRVIYIAGQLGLVDGKLAGEPGDFRAQAEQAFRNLQIALSEVGAEFRHVVKMNNYLTNMGDVNVMREVRDRFLNVQAPPASTTVGVTELARKGALFEIEVVAVLPP